MARGVPGMKRKRWGFLVVATILVLLLFEGAAGGAAFLWNALRSGGASLRYYAAAEERRHMRYDPELGWVGLPDREIPDLYGPGNGLRTERHGFRNDRNVEAKPPAGRRRVICSGDSFTFGQGVAGDETWCHLLGQLDPTVDPVNMGQRGYGVDQAYLWYLRDGTRLAHRLHLLAFISGDFSRMQQRTHHGYGKPLLALEDGRIVTHNVPVPQFRTWWPWMSRLGRAAAELHVVKLGRRLLDRPGAEAPRADDGATRQVALAVFRDLARLHAARGSRIVLVWLPVQEEIVSEERRWRPWLEQCSAAEGLTLYDLSQELRALDPYEAREFFIQEADTAVLDAAGHYNERGHAWVAQRLHQRLAAEPWWSP